MKAVKQHNGTPTILITVDVEDYFQVENLRSVYPAEIWDSCDLRVDSSVRKLLDLFKKFNVQATFFVLGWIAERCPGLIRDIKSQGHEVASHGYMHMLHHEQSLASLREDVYKSKVLLQDITGEEVCGYRAPCFSINEDLLATLGELGFAYDSSYNSFAMNKRYGNGKGCFHGTKGDFMTAKSGVVELPVSNLESGGFVVPWGGGGYFRLWPQALFEAGVARIIQKNGRYMFYCHPWEIDSAQPRVDGIGFMNRFRHYMNIGKTFDKLERFFSRFQGCSFVSCSTYLGGLQSDGTLKPEPPMTPSLLQC
jgi:polysaccharide deacetylase family protein (PEP-CTERM system associated)